MCYPVIINKTVTSVSQKTNNPHKGYGIPLAIIRISLYNRGKNDLIPKVRRKELMDHVGI